MHTLPAIKPNTKFQNMLSVGVYLKKLHPLNSGLLTQQWAFNSSIKGLGNV